MGIIAEPIGAVTLLSDSVLGIATTATRSFRREMRRIVQVEPISRSNRQILYKGLLSTKMERLGDFLLARLLGLSGEALSVPISRQKKLTNTTQTR